MPDEGYHPKRGNYTQIWNELLRKLRSYKLDSNEWSIVMTVISVTWMIKGKAWGVLRWKYILEKTELADSSAYYAIAKLKARNIIHTKPSGKHTQYKINSHFKTWKALRNIPQEAYRKRRLLHPGEVKKEDIPLHRGEVADFTGVKQTLHPGEVVPLKENNKENSLKKTTKGNGGLVPKTIVFLTPEEQIDEDAKIVLDYLNKTSGKGYSFSCDNLAPIINILKNGHNLEECLTVCERKWLDSSFSNVYFRPSTLFNPSYFERYLNETGSKRKPASKTDERRIKNMQAIARSQNARQQENQRGKDR